MKSVDRRAGGCGSSGHPGPQPRARVRPRAFLTVAAVLAEIAIFMTAGGTPVAATAFCLVLPLVVLLPLLFTRDELSPAGHRTVNRAFRAARRMPRRNPERLALEVALHGLPALRSAFPELVTAARVDERRPLDDSVGESE